jgi:hypothetical protein
MMADWQGMPWAIAVDANGIYWTDAFNDSVMEMPLGGGVPATLASSQNSPNSAFGIAANDGNIYWTNSGTSNANYHDGTVMKASLGGGGLTILASGQNYTEDIAVDAMNVYWTNYGDGTVMKAPKSGGTPTIIASGQNHLLGIAVDAAAVYWTTAGMPNNNDFTDGTVMKMPLDGGTPTVLASGQAYPIGIAVDETSVYWINTGTQRLLQTDGTVMKLTPK